METTRKSTMGLCLIAVALSVATLPVASATGYACARGEASLRLAVDAQDESAALAELADFLNFCELTEVPPVQNTLAGNTNVAVKANLAAVRYQGCAAGTYGWPDVPVTGALVLIIPGGRQLNIERDGYADAYVTWEPKTQLLRYYAQASVYGLDATNKGAGFVYVAGQPLPAETVADGGCTAPGRTICQAFGSASHTAVAAAGLVLKIEVTSSFDRC